MADQKENVGRQSLIDYTLFALDLQQRLDELGVVEFK